MFRHRKLLGIRPREQLFRGTGGTGLDPQTFNHQVHRLGTRLVSGQPNSRLSKIHWRTLEDLPARASPDPTPVRHSNSSPLVRALTPRKIICYRTPVVPRVGVQTYLSCGLNRVNGVVGPGSHTQATGHAAGPSAGVSMLRVVVATRLPPGSCPLCRPGDRRCVGQVTDVCAAVRHADRSRSIPVGYPGRRMIEHDCNPAAREAVYPVGEEHDPDSPAPQQGAGRDLTCRPYPGATATPRELTGPALALWRATAQQAHWWIRHQCNYQEPLQSQRSHAVPAARRSQKLRVTASARFSSRLSGAASLIVRVRPRRGVFRA